jgi:hypothetical protein
MIMAIPVIGKILDVLASSQVGATSATQHTDGRKGPCVVPDEDLIR